MTEGSGHEDVSELLMTVQQVQGRIEECECDASRCRSAFDTFSVIKDHGSRIKDLKGQHGQLKSGKDLHSGL